MYKKLLIIKKRLNKANFKKISLNKVINIIKTSKDSKLYSKDELYLKIES